MTAVEPVTLLVIPASAFRTFLRDRPSVALAMLAMLSSRLRASDRRLAEFAAADTLGRVCARLAELCDTYGEAAEGGSVRITLPLSQEDLAGWTGASLESTAKALRALRQLGWVVDGPPRDRGARRRGAAPPRAVDEPVKRHGRARRGGRELVASRREVGWRNEEPHVPFPRDPSQRLVAGGCADDLQAERRDVLPVDEHGLLVEPPDPADEPADTCKA